MTGMKTQPYSSSGEVDKTQAYDSTSGRTEAYEIGSSGKTTGYEEQGEKRIDQTDAHGIRIGDEIELKGKKYHIDEIISGDQRTLEAVIYKISDAEGKEYTLKLYYKFRNPKNEPNPEALERIRKINDADILKLYDYGTGENKYQGKFCFEICDYARGSDLLSVTDIKEKYTPDFIRSNVIPEIFKGIRTLHDYKIYHCDLKPQNVLFLDEAQTDLIIGDYGSAKTFEEFSEKEISFTDIVKGSDFYLAPEQIMGFVSTKNDYYSFGMILLHMLYPEFVNRISLKKIRERLMSRKPIIDYNPDYKDLNDLIAGLTLFDSTSRWGEKEVKAWLNNENIEVRYTNAVEAQIKPIKLGSFTIYKTEDLVEYIETHSQWYEYLIEDSDGYRLLLQFVYEIFDLEKKKSFDKETRTYQQDGRDFLKVFLTRYFQSPMPIQIDMKGYDFGSSQNLSELAVSFFRHLNDIAGITSIEKLKLYVFQFEFVIRQIWSRSDEKQKSLVENIVKNISFILSLSSDLTFENSICEIYGKIENSLDIFKILYVLNPSQPLKIKDGIEITHLNKLEETLSSHPELIKILKEFLYNGKIEVWFQAAFPDNNQDQTFIFKCRNTYKKDKDLGVYVFRWHFQKSLPFPFGNTSAKNPKELASLIDNQSTDKNLVIKLLSNGWIRAWLLTTGYIKDTEKFDTAIKTADKGWSQCIESVLHVLDPELPWPKITSSHDSIKQGRVSIESSKTIEIKVENKDRGFLTGEILLEGTGKGFSIDKNKINGEPLTLSLTINPRGLPVGSKQKISLSVQTNAGNLQIPVSYKVTAPVIRMVGRSIGIGFICAIIFGLFRLIIPNRFLVWHDWDQVGEIVEQPIIIFLMILFVGIIGGGLFYFNTLSKIQEQNYKKPNN